MKKYPYPNIKITWQLSFVLVLYCILFEWRSITEIKNVNLYINVLKVILPFFPLLALVSLTPPKSVGFRRYTLFFIIFLLWGLVPSIMSAEAAEALQQWSKYAMRFIFCYLAVLFLMQNSSAQKTVLKILVIIALLTVVQYIILEIVCMAGMEQSFSIAIPRGGTYYGPFGLLGSGTAQFSYFFKVPRFRLTGFWLEPSNASAFMFMAFFLSQALYIGTQQTRWKMIGYLCGIGGFCSFANAGYFGIGWGLLVGNIIDFFTLRRNRFLTALYIPACMLIILFSVAGRFFVMKYHIDNEYIMALAGIRGTMVTYMVSGASNSPQMPDPFDGRLTLAVNDLQQKPELSGGGLKAVPSGRELSGGGLKAAVSSLKLLRNVFMGTGFRIEGLDAYGRGMNISYTAPIMWLTYTGLVGLIFLLAREMQTIKTGFKHSLCNSFVQKIFQAWTVLFFQNMVAGTWMTPVYFLITGLVFSAAYHSDSPAFNIRNYAGYGAKLE